MKIVLKVRGKYTLIARTIGNRLVRCQPYLVAFEYDIISQTWEHGHYFNDLDSALDFINTKN